MAAFLTILSIATYAGFVFTTPSPQCSASFRWDDCGKTPTPVIYYWKPGSRCEVGIWRGCLPNINMFKDEYECVTTCIFTVRAADQNFHQINAEDGDKTTTIMDYNGPGFTTELDNSTLDIFTEAANGTTVEGDAGGGDSNDTTSANSDDDKDPDTDTEDDLSTPEPSENETTSDKETITESGETPAEGGETPAEGGETTTEGGETTAESS